MAYLLFLIILNILVMIEKTVLFWLVLGWHANIRLGPDESLLGAWLG
jgi:hypothetical protein